jgi:arylsulfatase A
MTKFFKRSLLSFFCIVNTFIFSDKTVFADQPNVIIIYTDDQGSFDLNCYGSKDLHTPHLDSLAAAGVRFTRMYSPSAICSASRAGLLTGRFPARAGVPGNVSSKKGVAGMPTEEITLAEHFMENGYKTGHVGKWHLGYTPETMPNSQGFESSFGHMGGCIDNYSHFFYWNGPNRHDLWQNGKEIFRDGEYFGELMIDQCRQFVSGNQSHPFFLYWAINWPHYPMQGTGKWREKYKDLPHPRNKYATFISTMDEMIGQLIKQLDDLGIRDNTIIVFQSDHGHSVEERAFYGGGNPGPFRGAKGSLFEGGIRVPSIISWPGELPENVTRDQTVCGIDWVPTLLNLAHCKQKNPERKLDGKDISLVIRKNEPTPHPFLYWQLGRGPSAQWAIIKDQWKILGNARDPRATNSLSSRDKKLFLIDLKKDISETTNLVDSEKLVTEQMTQLRAIIAKGL